MLDSGSQQCLSVVSPSSAEQWEKRRSLTICSSAINGTNVYVIYAQTADFSIDDVPCSDPTPSSSAVGTVTVTQTLSCGASKDDNSYVCSSRPRLTVLP